MRQMHGVAGEAGQWLKDAAAEVSDQVGVQGSSQINAQASAQISGQLDGEAAGAAHAANDYVKTHPWAAVGLGAVAGVLLGLLVSKRPR
jgi:ElaB/YqjD/DUF883 family membrane-anchored ribosome-binding protein